MTGRPSQKNHIIVLDIGKTSYNFRAVYENWREYLVMRVCPACGCDGPFVRHARYTKHYYSEQVWILRIRCRDCGTTHAIIPSFSLPDTSIGTEEAEEYLTKRAEQIGRGTAGKKLLELGMSEKYLRQLDEMFQVSVDRAKALFPDAGQMGLGGMEWVRSVVGEGSRVLYALNVFCLEHGVNPVCFSRASILVFSVSKSGRKTSHNLGAFQKSPAGAHSP